MNDRCIIMQESDQINHPGIPSWTGFEDLLIHSSYSVDDYVKSWRLSVIIRTWKKGCCQILLLHVGECVFGKHSDWNSFWATPRISSSATNTVTFSSFEWLWVPVRISVYFISIFLELINLVGYIHIYSCTHADSFFPLSDRIPRTIGVSIPMKATFFITYIMVDGWAGIASEILRLKPLVIYHLKNMFLVKTDRDRERAMHPGSVGLPETLPTLQLYFLLGLVYAVVTPVLLPFILVFFAFAYFVYRHQVSNVPRIVIWYWCMKTFIVLKPGSASGTHAFVMHLFL